MYDLFKILTIYILFVSCGTKQGNVDPVIQTGDLLFQQWDESDFAKAINAVTEGADGEDYAHVGLVLFVDDSLQVLEAIADKGVVLRPLHDFLNANFFELAPMTFKDPTTGNFFPIWEGYYQNYNEAIPEGELGINPGLMSRSEKIEIVDKLWDQ